MLIVEGKIVSFCLVLTFFLYFHEKSPHQFNLKSNRIRLTVYERNLLWKIQRMLMIKHRSHLNSNWIDSIKKKTATTEYEPKTEWKKNQMYVVHYIIISCMTVFLKLLFLLYIVFVTNTFFFSFFASFSIIPSGQRNQDNRKRMKHTHNVYHHRKMDKCYTMLCKSVFVTHFTMFFFCVQYSTLLFVQWFYFSFHFVIIHFFFDWIGVIFAIGNTH